MMHPHHLHNPRQKHRHHRPYLRCIHRQKMEPCRLNDNRKCELCRLDASDADIDVCGHLLPVQLLNQADKSDVNHYNSYQGINFMILRIETNKRTILTTSLCIESTVHTDFKIRLS
eukprot:69796_1